MIDGEQIRKGINRDLGYSVQERSENLRRSAHLAKLLNDQGLICVAAFVAPSQSVRERVAEVVGKNRFHTVYLTAPLETRKARDQKGLYAQAEEGKLADFAEMLAHYEAPENPDLVLDTAKNTTDDCVDKIIELLRAKGVLTR